MNDCNIDKNNTIIKLPFELLCYITKFVNDKDVIMLSSTCKNLRYLFDILIAPKGIYLSKIVKISKYQKNKNKLYDKISWNFGKYYDPLYRIKSIANIQYINKNINKNIDHLILNNSNLFHKCKFEGVAIVLYSYNFIYSKKKDVVKFLDNITTITFNFYDLYDGVGFIPINPIPLPNIKTINIVVDHKLISGKYEKFNNGNIILSSDFMIHFRLILSHKNIFMANIVYNNNILAQVLVKKENYKDLMYNSKIVKYFETNCIYFSRKNNNYSLSFKYSYD